MLENLIFKWKIEDFLMFKGGIGKLCDKIFNAGFVQKSFE